MIESLDLQLLAPADWQVLRQARLEALRDSPHAFTSSHGRESVWGEQEWRRVIGNATWIVAQEIKVIGLAKSVTEPWRPWARHIESIWVAPAHRRRGVCRRLLQILGELDRDMGVTDLLLWVLEDNHDAQRAYEALGFQSTGERQYLPAFGRFERRFRWHIKAPPTRLMDPDSKVDEGARTSAQMTSREFVEVLADRHQRQLTNVPILHQTGGLDNPWLAARVGASAEVRDIVVHDAHVVQR